MGLDLCCYVKGCVSGCGGWVMIGGRKFHTGLGACVLERLDPPYMCLHMYVCTVDTFWDCLWNNFQG